MNVIMLPHRLMRITASLIRRARFGADRARDIFAVASDERPHALLPQRVTQQLASLRSGGHQVLQIAACRYV